MKRSNNFIAGEVETLLVLVEERKDIIENRTSDVVTWKGKEKAWEEIKELFNSMHSNQRTVGQIRNSLKEGLYAFCLFSSDLNCAVSMSD